MLTATDERGLGLLEPAIMLRIGCITANTGYEVFERGGLSFLWKIMQKCKKIRVQKN
jgi:hypothetical protein